MKTICLYYSRTNMTKETIETLAEILDADVFEYTDGKKRDGVLGYIVACFDSLKRKLPNVTIKGAPDFSVYDRVIIGMPLWAEGPCVVGRTLLEQYRDVFPEDVYYVVTHMAKNDYMKKIKGLDKILGRPSKGQISLRTKDNDYIKEIKALANNF